MSFFNNWDEEKIIRMDKIKKFEFLDENNFIKEIENKYYYLTTSIADVERKFYEEENAAIANELDLQDVQKEMVSFIKKLNKYNQAKDIAQSLMGKIAELRGVTIKAIHDEMEISLNDEI
ncbi:uncharacterized protein VICG_00520 [Vittaforma corneae ATCC 50505]|uniref:Swi5-domain-containing protein n=1 Tax=Vittaforma corneae (strain ATCC 50505) TaxID=993615 RepID=L2GNK7_VITCO|nr:uncharacterized protein VICG_00520 [Vittaforma corneae ATCC 50505]ELA42421.1 hypothetical protein VICG_00520 [Vittaforma corneae ATCC 50505]